MCSYLFATLMIGLGLGMRVQYHLDKSILDQVNKALVYCSKVIENDKKRQYSTFKNKPLDVGNVHPS